MQETNIEDVIEERDANYRALMARTTECNALEQRSAMLLEALHRVTTTYEAALKEYEGIQAAHDCPVLAEAEAAIAKASGGEAA